jgi:hypothetical protein
MATVEVHWDDAAIALSTRQPGGPVDRAMSRLADEAMVIMKQLAPVYSGPPRVGPTPGHPRQTARRSGTMRSSIRKFRQSDGSYLIGPTDEVKPGTFLGALIERGTPAHIIRSHGAWPLYSTATRQRYGRPVYAGPPGQRRLLYWEVRHPGTRAQPFIRPAARALNGRTIRIS